MDIGTTLSQSVSIQTMSAPTPISATSTILPVRRTAEMLPSATKSPLPKRPRIEGPEATVVQTQVSITPYVPKIPLPLPVLPGTAGSATSTLLVPQKTRNNQIEIVTGSLDLRLKPNIEKQISSY